MRSTMNYAMVTYMTRELLNLGSVTIYTHGTFLVVGIILALLSILILVKKLGLNQKIVLDLVIYTTFFGIIGARLLNYALYNSAYGSFWEIFYFWNGGLVSWGGFIFGILAFMLTLRLHSEKVFPWLDVLAVGFLVGFAVGRLGSFLSGEKFGVAYDGFLSISGTFPVTFIEFVWVLVLFVILFLRLVKSKKAKGEYFFGIIALYALGRMVTDFGRAEPDMIMGLSPGQIVSLIVFLLGAFIYIGKISKKLKEKE